MIYTFDDIFAFSIVTVIGKVFLVIANPYGVRNAPIAPNSNP